MHISKSIKLAEFIKTQPFMSIQPSKYNELILEGNFNMVVQYDGFPKINKTYNLQIKIFQNFPYSIPIVTEVEGKIPRDGNHHVNPDKTLCLGSQIKLLELIHKKPTLEGFVEYCLIPFLYAATLKMEYNIDFIFGELAHGDDGLIDEYCALFGVTNKEQVLNVLTMLTLNKRVANKWSCPCQCENRLGKCSLRFKINKYRKIAFRSWYKNILHRIYIL